MSRSLMKWVLPEVVNPPDRVCYLVSLPNDPAYIRAFRGSIYELTRPYRWMSDEAHTALLVSAALEETWEALHTIGCDALMPDENTPCIAYPLNSPWITYGPVNPFTEPATVPSGYLLPPMTVVKPGDAYNLIGWHAGDLLTDLERFPIGSLPTIIPPLGFARLELHLTGTGVVSVHFVNHAFGGIAYVTQDGNPLLADYVELDQDILSIPTEGDSPIIKEYTFQTPGPHILDITFLPWLNAAISFIGYGGAIRSIELCGIVPDPAYIPDETVGGAIDLGDNEMKIRVNPDNPCQLQKMCDCDSEWSLFFDPFACSNVTIPDQVKGVVTQPAAAGGIPAGQCREYDVVVNGNQEWLFPSPVSAGYTIELTAITGGWNDGAGAGGWFCPDGSAYILGDCIGGKGHATGDPATALFHGQLFADVGGTFYDPFAGPFTIPGGVSNASFTLRMNDVSLTDNYGSISLHVKVCAETPTDQWTHNFNFLTSNGGFGPYRDSQQRDRAAWTSGQGWGYDAFNTSAQIEFIVQGKVGTVSHVQFRLDAPMTARSLFQFGNGSTNLIEEAGALATYEMDVNIDFSDKNDVFVGIDDYPNTVPHLTGITVTGTGQDIFT